ncbi:unnamed protein product [Peronospora farinosa]|uniref:Sec1 family domain-containing protein 1 n=1 Tax=Peronospora farinosa TaxID=134698 RepID=A0ABN8BT39_9STRA|nr:unnamed protein product [Peronospora farinosa]
MMTSAVSQSLQEKQRENLLRMLDFNSESTGGFADAVLDSVDRWGDQWKVLIYDKFCRDIISPILKLHELRKKGVTLHMRLDTERDAIPDVPAIYFVEPTHENLTQIVSDCSKELYSSAHLNFAYPLSRESLEYLARASVEAGCTSMIAKVYDQYTNFVSLEPSLFSLNLPASYRAYNDPNVADAQIEQSMSVIVKGLFSVLATSGRIPVIRCPNNDGPSRMVAEQLSSTIREHLNVRNGVFADNTSSFQRPVLIIMDRNEDIASSLHHPSTYQALVDDILSIQMNRVKVSVKTSGDDGDSDGRSVERMYELDVTSDKFFETHAGSLFPDAIDANEKEMKLVTGKEERIRAQTGGGNALMNGTKDLVAAVDTLPALVEKKKMLEVHTNIFHAAFEGVTKRHIPSYSMLEQKLIDGLHVDKTEVLQLLSSTEMGTLADKMRLLMIYFLSSGASGAEMADFENAYQQCAAASEQPEAYMQAWKFLRKHSAFQRRASVGGSLQSEGGAGPDGGANNMSKFKGLAQGFLAQAAASFKNFLPENKKLHVTRVTDAICEMKPNTEDETFLYLDPKIKATGDVPRQRSPFREVMVFMIGGGNYNEYHNLLAYAKESQSPRSIWYGCTELLSPEAFLHQLGSIGT